MSVLRIIKSKNYGNGGHSAALRSLPFGSLNKRICSSLTLAQICLRQASHIPGTLYLNTKEARILINTKKFPALKLSVFHSRC